MQFNKDLNGHGFSTREGRYRERYVVCGVWCGGSIEHLWSGAVCAWRGVHQLIILTRDSEESKFW